MPNSPDQGQHKPSGHRRQASLIDKVKLTEADKAALTDAKDSAAKVSLLSIFWLSISPVTLLVLVDLR